MDKLIKEEKINLHRQKEFDVVKALAILFMIVIHVYEEFYYADTTYICSDFIDITIQFLGGPLAAPVFMFSMGLGMSYSSHRTPKELLIRGIKIFIFSYIFNILRYIIPFFLTGGAGEDTTYYVLYLTFLVDILTFAGLSFIFTALFKKLKVSILGMLLIAIGLQFVGLIINDTVTFEGDFACLFFAPLVKTSFISYFPFCQWYIYPVLGLVYAKYLRHIEDTDRLYGIVLLVATLFLLGYSISLNYVGYDIRNFFTLTEDSYYDQTILHVLFTLPCVLIELSIVHFILKIVHIKWLDKVISFLSNNLNNIYIAQWIIIGWLSYFVFYEAGILSLGWVIPVGILLTIVASLIVYLYKNIKGKISAKKTNKN